MQLYNSLSKFDVFSLIVGELEIRSKEDYLFISEKPKSLHVLFTRNIFRVK